MVTRYASAVLLALVSSLAVLMAAAHSPSPQSSPAQSQTGGSAQASSQGAVAVGGSGPTAEGSASSQAAAHAGDNGAELAGNSSVNAVLTKPVDSRKSKPGELVTARTSQPCRTNDGRSIPKGSSMVGHVSEVHSRGEGHADSAVGIVFDKAVMRDGHEIPLRNVGIRALAAAEGSAAGSVRDGGTMTGAGGGMGGGMTAGRGGGGLVGRTTGAVGGTVGGGVGAAGGAAGSLAGGASGMLEAGPGAVGGLDITGLLTAGSLGVFGLHDVGLAATGSSATQGSVVTSTGKSVRLDQGTRLLLSTQAGDSARGDHDSDTAGAKRSPPDKR